MCTARRAVCFVHNAVNIGVEMHDYGNRCFSSDTLSTVDVNITDPRLLRLHRDRLEILRLGEKIFRSHFLPAVGFLVWSVWWYIGLVIFMKITFLRA